LLFGLAQVVAVVGFVYKSHAAATMAGAANIEARGSDGDGDFAMSECSNDGVTTKVATIMLNPHGWLTLLF
jgi:hypothetical protein